MRLAINVSGKVQGVGFRYSSRAAASRLKLNGLVRNEADGTVYIEIEGDEPDVAEFLRWCRVGPSNAIVESISFTELDPAGFADFKIY